MLNAAASLLLTSCAELLDNLRSPLLALLCFDLLCAAVDAKSLANYFSSCTAFCARLPRYDSLLFSA